MLPINLTRLRFIPTPLTFLLLVSSDPRLSGARQVSDAFQDLYFFVGASVGGVAPSNGLECASSSALAVYVSRIPDEECPTYGN